MKTYYTVNELKRLATEKAVELINENKGLIMSNTSYGGGILNETFVGLPDTAVKYHEIKTYYIGLNGGFGNDKMTLDVYLHENGQYKFIETIVKVYEIYSKGERMYVTDKEAYKKNVERQRKHRFDEKPFIEYYLKADSQIAKNIIAKLQKKTGKKIKPQSLKINKYNNIYKVFYTYRNVEKSQMIQVVNHDKKFLYWV